jgi:hypothetical protein
MIPSYSPKSHTKERSCTYITDEETKVEKRLNVL